MLKNNEDSAYIVNFNPPGYAGHTMNVTGAREVDGRMMIELIDARVGKSGDNPVTWREFEIYWDPAADGYIMPIGEFLRIALPNLIRISPL